ncbi:MAG: hypothetical protein M3Z98_01310 [Candidatus Dormibacteraeota bacterium]|nr:hypothetical protein [Candidatus Dormibacteraeota bacterium]
MRIRHLVLVLLGLAAAALAVQLAAPGSGEPAVVLDDGTIQVTAGEEGRGAWVPYTITVRNLGDRDFTGRLLLLKKIIGKPGPVPQLAIPGMGSLAAPVTPGGQANPPDAAFQFPVALSPRHKRTYSFFAPDDFISVVVQDTLGRQVAEGPVDDRKSIAVGTLTDSPTLPTEIEPIRLGDYTLKVTQWNDGNPFPDRAAYLSGYSAIVIDHFDSGRLSKAQLTALTEFVGLGGELVLAGGSDLARTIHALPPQLVAFSASGPSPVESLAPVADLFGLPTDLAAPVAGGTLAAGAVVVLDTAAGRPLMTELAYGSGRVVELLFDPDSPAAGAGSPSGLTSLAFSQAIGRGLQSIPGTQPSGRLLVDTGELPAALFPRPSDSPFPPLWLVGGLLAIYLLLVVPANYLVVRRLGSPGLFWATTPAFAVLFTMLTYLIGQGLQAGIRDQEIQFYRVGPDGIASRVAVHGIVFPAHGDHQVSFGSDSLAAPYTIGYPDLSPFCIACAFPGTSGSLVEEHVLPGDSPTIAERGIVYGSVRVVGSAATGSGQLSLSAHLASASGKITGSIANTGKVPVRGLLIYTYYLGLYRATVVAKSLAPGETVQVDNTPEPIGDAAPNLPSGTKVTTLQAISLIADEAGRRNLSHPGQLAIVGFVKPSDSELRVDGSPPGGQVIAAFGMPVEVESAQGRLGEVGKPQLASFYPVGVSSFVDTYDIALPSASGSLVLRYDIRLYSDVAVYDWSARTWRQGVFNQDPNTPIVKFTQLSPSEVRGGLVRVRVSESVLTLGSELAVRFASEAP